MFQWSQQIGVVCSRERCCFFAGFHKQPSFGLLRGLLYLEERKSGRAFGIQPEITTFRTSSLFWALLFFLEDRKFFFSCVVGFYRSQSQHIAAQALAKVQHVRLCCELACFGCEGCDRLWSLVSIHLEASHAVVRPANTCMETRLQKKHRQTSVFFQHLLVF